MSDKQLGELLDRGAETLQLALDSRQRQQLLDYVALLDKWNRTYNLTAVREPLDMMRQHVIDCLAVVPSLRAHLRSDVARANRLVDVGSGAGLPGLVFAIALPELQVACVDSVGKKASFIAQAAATLKIGNAEAHHARIESFAAEPFDIASSRALTSLTNFVAQTAHLLAPWGRWMAMKGLRPDAELNELAPQMTFHVEQIAVPSLAAERCVVWIESLKQSERTLTQERHT